MAGRVVVIGLGPGDPSLLGVAALDAVARIPVRYLRTARHPSAAAVGDAATFDHVYDSAASLEEVYGAIVEALVVAAAASGEVLYAVPGSPLVAERTVELLRRDPRVAAEILPALSFLDLAWARLGIDPLATGVRLVDGHRFVTEAAGQRGPLLVAQCDTRNVLSDIKLALPDGGPELVVLQRLGTDDEAVRVVSRDDLDRVIDADHLTSVWIPALAAPVGAELAAFDELVHTLRQRCPWDREQTHRSLGRHLLEETYEVLDAIDGLGPDLEGAEHLEEELGDVLFQVFFHAVLGEEHGAFTLADVTRGVHDKLVRRHPHVFGDIQADTPGQVAANWDEIKEREKGRSSVMDGIPAHLPALVYALKVQRRAASVGFDWSDAEGAWPKVPEEVAELRAAIDSVPGSNGGPVAGGDPGVADELGDVLFAVVNVARHLGVDPEGALRTATAKFRARFAGVEQLAGEREQELRALSLAQLDGLWDEVKVAERQRP